MSEPVIRVRITEAMREEASRRQHIINNMWPPEKSYTGLFEPNAHISGYLGQLGFGEILESNHKQYLNGEREPGRPDVFDFIVFIWKRPQKLDVKTNSKKHGVDMMMPEVQFQNPRKQFDIYVGARISGDWIELHGWITRDRLAERKPKQLRVLTRYCPLVQLNPIISLLQIIQ